MPVSVKGSNEVDCKRQGLRVPTTQPAFIELQNTILRSPSSFQHFWGKNPEATTKETL